MANNLYLGTALTRDLKVDNSGQDALLDIAKSGAAQRANAAADKEKQRAQTEKDVLKNMAIESNLSTPYYQRAFSKKMSEKMATIVEAAKNGDENLAVLGNQAKQQMLNYVGALRAKDKEIQGVMGEVAKDPLSYAQDKQTVLGKEYNNFYEAFNDPIFDTEEGKAAVMAAYGGTEYGLEQGTPESIALGMPEATVSYNPMKMSDPYEFAQDLIEPEMFTDFYDGKLKHSGGRVWEEQGLAMNQESLDLIREKTLVNGSVLRHYEEQLYKEQKAINPELTRAEFSQTDWMKEVPARVENDVIKPLKDQSRNPTRVERTPRAPKATNPTGVDALFDVGRTPQVTHGHRGTSTGGTSYEYLPKGSKSKVTKVTTLPTGTVMVTSTGDIEAGSATDDYYTAEGATKKVTQAEVAPWRMTYSGDKLWFDYSAEDGTYYAVPLTVGSYRDWANRTGEKETPEVVLERAKSLTKNENSVMNLVRGYHKDLYGDGDDEFDPTNF